MHEHQKERRLLSLKIKEAQRIMPQNKLKPLSRDRSAGPRKVKRKMKNSTISDANKSVIVTNQEARMKKSKIRDLDSKSKSKREEPEKQNDIEKPNVDVRPHEPGPVVEDRRDSIDNMES